MSESSPHVGVPDRRTAPRSGDRNRDLEYPESFPREQLGVDRWEWTNRRVAVVVGVVALLTTLCSAALAILVAQGWRTESPADVTRGQDAKIEAMTTSLAQINRSLARLATVTEAGGRYTCKKDRDGAEQTGYPCATLLDGRGILSGTSSQLAPADGSQVIAVLRGR